MNSVETIFYAALTSALLTLLISIVQAAFGAKGGSDHPAHFFLVRAIRENGYRLFGRIPGLLNDCYCGALPLYIHWILSFFRPNAMFWAERLLNPAINAVHVLGFGLLIGIAARTIPMATLYLWLATLAFALTPQFYHALSARNFGLSARGTGLMLLTFFLLAARFAGDGASSPLWWLVLVPTAWLIWGFSTFAQQALLIVSAILFVTTGNHVPLTGALGGMALFFLIHRQYSLSYLKYTYKFLRAYSRELAPIYIISKRPSIWGDWIGDIWRQLRSHSVKGGLYAYGNSVLIVLLLNPFVLLSSWLALADRTPSPFMAYASDVTLAGAIATVLTSFKSTRFLGEPERYAEAVTPWAVLCGSYFVYSEWGVTALLAITATFGVSNVAQLYASLTLMKHLKSTGSELDTVQAAITKSLGTDVRFASNNEQITKLLMKNQWRFSLFWVVGQDYCGMSVADAFSAFPNLKREACERLVSTYRINACVLDRHLYDTLFDLPPPALQDMHVVYESAALRVFVLRWTETTQPAANHATADVGA